MTGVMIVDMYSLRDCKQSDPQLLMKLVEKANQQSVFLVTKKSKIKNSMGSHRRAIRFSQIEDVN